MQFPTVDLDGLKAEYKCTYDSGDPWGSNVAWMFAICGVLYHRNDCDGAVLDKVGFQPGAGWPSSETSDQECRVWAIKRASTDTLERFLRVLNHVDIILRKRGLAY